MAVILVLCNKKTYDSKLSAVLNIQNQVFTKWFKQNPVVESKRKNFEPELTLKETRLCYIIPISKMVLKENILFNIKHQKKK